MISWVLQSPLDIVPRLVLPRIYLHNYSKEVVQLPTGAYLLEIYVGCRELPPHVIKAQLIKRDNYAEILQGGKQLIKIPFSDDPCELR